MNKIKISAILAVFNEEKFIIKAIESLINQTIREIEIIIVNDGSSDNSLNIINDYCKKDSRITIINQENMGLGASRNNAMKIAKGEYIAFLDGDDWFKLDALEIAYNEASKKNTDITFFQIINYDDESGKTYENDWFNLNSFTKSFNDCVFTPEKTKDFLFDLSVSACQKIYKNKFLKSIKAEFPEGIYFEDMPFFFEVYLKAKRISIIKKHLYCRRKHENSITHVVDEKYLDTVPAGVELMKRFIDNGFYETYKFDLLAYKINGPKFALKDITNEYKEPLFNLIKDDYEKIKKTKYYDDFLDNLGPVKKKFS